MIFKSYIKLSVLKELNKEKLSGYDLISRLGEFGGKKPSPGYIYPLLKELEEKKFLTFKNSKRRKIYTITNNGKKLLESLQKNHKESLDNMTKTLSPIADVKEMNDFIKFKQELNTHKSRMLRDIDVMEKFHKSLFKVYAKNDITLNKKMREIIKKMTKEIEKIANDNR